jgi:molecular chaperone IbpA
MRTNLDFSPFFRSSIGFDRAFDALFDTGRVPANDAWPPYDVEKSGDDYRITMAVAGYALGELAITQQPNLLIVTGNKAEHDVQYLHRGIPGGSFEHRFELADYVKVEGASLTDGLLTIQLKREVPEAMKPRQIEIATAPDMASGQTQQLEHQAKAA